MYTKEPTFHKRCADNVKVYVASVINEQFFGIRLALMTVRTP